MRPALALSFVAFFAIALPNFVLAQKPTRPSIELAVQDYSFRVPARPSWSDTQIDLEPGDRIHIYGSMSDCEGPAHNEKAHLILRSAPAGALLARLELEAAPVVATPDADMPIVVPGHLYLAVNGLDCYGTIPVRIHLERGQAAPKKPQSQSH